MALDAAARKPLLDRYRNGPVLLRQAWDEVPLEARAWRPAAGKWSAHEVVIHCANSETDAFSQALSTGVWEARHVC